MSTCGHARHPSDVSGQLYRCMYCGEVVSDAAIAQQSATLQAAMAQQAAAESQAYFTVYEGTVPPRAHVFDVQPSEPPLPRIELLALIRACFYASEELEAVMVDNDVDPEDAQARARAWKRGSEEPSSAEARVRRWAEDFAGRLMKELGR